MAMTGKVVVLIHVVFTMAMAGKVVILIHVIFTMAMAGKVVVLIHVILAMGMTLKVVLIHLMFTIIMSRLMTGPQTNPHFTSWIIQILTFVEVNM